jgi:hypothetical protein
MVVLLVLIFPLLISHPKLLNLLPTTTTTTTITQLFKNNLSITSSIP